MPDIRHRIEIAAPLESVYEAAATPEGVAGWWSRDGVSGDAAVGSRLEFRFGRPDPAAVVEITRLDPAGHVAWRCVEGPADWVGTDIAFDMSELDGRTVLLFAHDGWREQTEFMAHCSARWAYFMLSLKSLGASGRGTPHPEDLKF